MSAFGLPVGRLARALLAVLTLTPLGPNFGPIVLVLFVYPFISAILWRRALQRAEIASTVLRFASWLGFVVVGAMMLLLLGTFLFCLSYVLAALMSWSDFLPFLLVMCLAVIVAVHALFSHARSRERGQARAKDVSPSDFDSSQEPRGDRG